MGKQRIEADQIYRALTRENYGWKNHPAVKMWKGFEGALLEYRRICIIEWTSRGYRNSMPIIIGDVDERYPLWFGDDRLHSSHRSNLLRKNSEYYSRFGWVEGADLPYYWPVK